MGVVVTQHFPDHLRALDRGVGFGQAKLTHGIKNTAVTGLHAVTDIRDGTADIHTQRILQVRSMHDILDAYEKIIGAVFAHFFLPYGLCKKLNLSFYIL